ncbi:MAG TPA: IclR family transcriptional regulator [Castellaniella sp.]|uniref:IclR family transcriptional regulator n=1 Tax=Castellaniella sp. TaxID=1955812 RepID=UPI002F10F9EC
MLLLEEQNKIGRMQRQAALTMAMAHTVKLEAAQGVQSVEVGLSLFDSLASHSEPCNLSDLARRVGMHRAKAYRYLVSLQRAGWVVQDPATGLYELGPAVRTLALRWLTQQDTLNQALEEARRLSEEQAETCFVSVWGGGGATAVRVFQPSRVVSIAIAEGAVLDGATSATGRVFSVWQAEPTHALPALLAARIRQDGFAAVEGDHMAGINAVAAPVFGAHGEVALSLTLVGPAASLRVAGDAPPARALLDSCRRLSVAPGIFREGHD